MKNEGKSEQLKILLARVDKDMEVIKSLDMSDEDWWDDFEARAKLICDNLESAMQLACDVEPSEVEDIIALRERLVNMRVEAYEKMCDIEGIPIVFRHVEPVTGQCAAMMVKGLDHESEEGMRYCTGECPYRGKECQGRE